MKDVMLDLETMGTSSRAPIIAIGACFFDPMTGDIGAQFESVIDLRSSARSAHLDPDTILWWMKQSEEARKVFNSLVSVDLEDGLGEFTDWISQIENPRSRQVWANGAGFDNKILANAFESLGLVTPWPFYNDRDVRTIVDLGRRLLGFDPKKEMPFEGTAHNALDDAIHQAKYVSAIIQRLNANVTIV